MYVDTLCRQISVCRWKDSGGGVNSELLTIAESDLRKRLTILSDKYKVICINDSRMDIDFENIKKRLEKDKITAVNFANESFARDLLGVIDALEMALNTQISEANSEAKTLKEGVSLTIESFKAALAKHGVKMIETSVGGEFNPEIHNAMSYVESDSIASGFIAQIYQNGYMYNERILRPAMVLIAK